MPYLPKEVITYFGPSVYISHIHCTVVLKSNYTSLHVEPLDSMLNVIHSIGYTRSGAVLLQDFGRLSSSKSTC